MLHIQRMVKSLPNIESIIEAEMALVEKAFSSKSGAKPKFDEYRRVLIKLKSINIIGKRQKAISMDVGCNVHFINSLVDIGVIKLQYRYSSDGKRRCGSCNNFLDVSSFGRCSRSKDGLRPICKSCKNRNKSETISNLREWEEINKHTKSDRDKKYRLKNKDRISERRKTDKYKILKSQSNRRRYEKILKEPKLLLEARVRSAVSTALSNGIKSSKTFDILGYTPSDLKSHLESLFKDGMSWENYGRGGWHIDHIRPLVMFDTNTEEGIREAWCLNNVQPLWERENCSKNSYYNGILQRRSNLK